ncbi:MAG: DUF3570 domain-containing protein [Labilithrix sp.]
MTRDFRSIVFALALVLMAILPRLALAEPNRGWENEDARNLAKEGTVAKRNGDISGCLAKDLASLALEDHPYVRLHIASCYAAQSKYKDALINARIALAAGIKNDDEDLKKAAATKVQDLIPRLAHLKIEIPEKNENLEITMNGQPLRPNQVKDKLTLDPGKYVVKAVREEKGERYSFEGEVKLAEGEDKTIEVLPKQDHLSPDIENCLRNAKSYKERLKCIEETQTRPNIHVGLEFSGYTDSTNVHVLSPAINFAVDSPTGGWNFGGSYLLDLVTAASPDLVSTASRHFREQRHAVAGGGGYKFKFGTVGLNTNVSSEPDYLSRTIGGNFSTELNEKMITPSFAYHYSWDTIGYRNTPFDNFNKSLNTHAIETGVTFVLSPSTLLVTGLALSFESGENAKLYRFIPMFDEDTAKNVKPGQDAASVNNARLNIRPRENVPQRRDRFAVAARVNHRFASATLRAEERIYTDDWGIKASTTDGKFLYDLSERLRVWPHLRIHAQSGASFYQLAYIASVTEKDTPIAIPTYRTSDRESSPMMAFTIGGGSRIVLTGEKTKPELAVVVSGDVMYNKYFQSLFILSRTAIWGTVGLDAEF